MVQDPRPRTVPSPGGQDSSAAGPAIRTAFPQGARHRRSRARHLGDGRNGLRPMRDRADCSAHHTQRERTPVGPSRHKRACWHGGEEYRLPRAGLDLWGHSQRMTVKPETAWQAGRLGSSSGAPRLLFGRMYEDAEIERAAFQGKGRVFCIASAGATAIELADQHEVVACDVNPAQLAYAERRADGGQQETGDAERAMNFARAFMPLVGWRTGVVRAFLALSDVNEQTAFWSKHLNTRRFRAAFDALLSPAILRTVYASEFLSFLPPKFGAVLRHRLERGFARHQNASNPYLRALLLGENGEHTRAKTPHIRFVLADAASWLESCPAGFFDGFALSNILDGAGAAYRSRLSKAIDRASTKEAVVVSRSFAEPPGLESNQAACDRSMLWGVVDVRSAKTF